MFKYLVLAVMLALAVSSEADTGVLLLNEAEFQQALEDHEYLFVKFYTPWCGHCKKLAPIFIELAAALKTSHPNIQLAQMDLDANKNIGSIYKVNSYPTLLLFNKGKAVKFGGGRNLQFMQFWLNKRTQPPLIGIQPEQVSVLEHDGNVNIVFYGSQGTPKADILAKISAADDYNMYYQVDGVEGKQKESLEIFRPFSRSVTNNVVDHTIKNWISLFDRPFVYPFDDRSSGEIFTDKRNAVFLFVPEGELGQKIRSIVLEVAADWKLKYKRRLIFAEIAPESENYSGLSDYFKIDPKRHFLLFVKTAQKIKFLHQGSPEELTKEKVDEFVKAAETKKLKGVKLDQQTRPQQQKKATDEL